MDKVRLHIPILTAEQIVLRDEIVKQLSKDYDTIIMEFEEIVRIDEGKIFLCPFSILQLYRDEVTNVELRYLKRFAGIISKQAGEPITLEVTRNTFYIGTVTQED